MMSCWGKEVSNKSAVWLKNDILECFTDVVLWKMGPKLILVMEESVIIVAYIHFCHEKLY